jgi:LmbE family N-acetylglucosaminyl deacetylase
VNDANFLAGLKKITTYSKHIKQKHWRSEFVYNYIQDYFMKPDFVIDITKHMDTKIESILTYTSQFKNPKNPNPNSITGLFDQIKSTNTIFGRQINVRYGEGFTINKYLGIQNLFDIY